MISRGEVRHCLYRLWSDELVAAKMALLLYFTLKTVRPKTAIFVLCPWMLFHIQCFINCTSQLNAVKLLLLLWLSLSVSPDRGVDLCCIHKHDTNALQDCEAVSSYNTILIQEPYETTIFMILLQKSYNSCTSLHPGLIRTTNLCHNHAIIVLYLWPRL